MNERETSLGWYPVHVEKWIASYAVKTMTLEEQGAYRSLLDWQWQGHGYLPADDSALSTIVGFDVTKYSKVLALFPVVEEGKRANKVQLENWRKQQARYWHRQKAAHRKWELELADKKEKNDKQKAKTPKPVDTTPIVISIPLIGGKEHNVTQAKVESWTQLFPRVDIDQTLREIKAWNDANPTMRKTESDVERHIVAWFTKEQNRGGVR